MVQIQPLSVVLLWSFFSAAKIHPLPSGQRLTKHRWWRRPRPSHLRWTARNASPPLRTTAKRDAPRRSCDTPAGGSSGQSFVGWRSWILSSAWEVVGFWLGVLNICWFLQPVDVLEWHNSNPRGKGSAASRYKPLAAPSPATTPSITKCLGWDAITAGAPSMGLLTMVIFFEKWRFLKRWVPVGLPHTKKKKKWKHTVIVLCFWKIM